MLGLYRGFIGILEKKMATTISKEGTSIYGHCQGGSQDSGPPFWSDPLIRGDFWGLLQEISVLGGPWDLVTTYNWACNPTYNPSKWAYRGYPKYK